MISFSCLIPFKLMIPPDSDDDSLLGGVFDPVDAKTAPKANSPPTPKIPHEVNEVLHMTAINGPTMGFMSQISSHSHSLPNSYSFSLG